MFTEIKGGDGAGEEEEKERRRLGQRGREVDGKGGRDHFEFPFRVAFIVLLQTLTSNTTQPLNPPSRRSVQSPAAPLFSIVRRQVDSNWLFFHEADFSTDPPPPRRGPFCCPSEVSISAYVVNMPDGRYQVVEAHIWTLKVFHLKPGIE